MEKKTMGTFLAALRRAQGLTQQEVADRLLVSNRAVSRWERDEAAPDISLLPAIADLFGVTVDELLRGERKRAAEEPAPMLDAPAAETPPDPRALRGMRALFRRARSQFVTGLLIPIALVLVGYITELALTYAAEKVYLGFALFCAFCVGSIVLSVIAVMHMRDTLGEQAPDTVETRLPDAELAELVRVLGRGCFAAIMTPAAGMLLSLPLVLYKKGSYIGDAFMMNWSEYLPLALMLACLLAIAGWLCYRPFRTAMYGKWAEVLDIPAPTGCEPAQNAVLRRLNLRQSIAAAAGFGGGVLLDMFIMSVVINGQEDEWPWVAARAVASCIALAGVAVPAVFLVTTYRKLGRTECVARRNVLLSGLRNVLVSLSVSSFWITGITYVSHGFNWRPSLIWTPQMIALWAIVTLAIFGLAEIIRRCWLRRI